MNCAVISWRVGFLLAGAVGCRGVPAAQDPGLEVVFRTQAFNQVAISPDGGQVMWVRPIAAAGSMESNRLRIFVGAAQAGEGRRLTAEEVGDGNYDEKEVGWSPDGGTIAYLSDREQRGQLQLYVQPAAGGAARRLTKLDGTLTRPQWSPDGTRLSFLFVAHVHGILSGGSAAAVPDGEVTEDGYVEQIMVADLSSGMVRAATPPDQYAFESDWSPDSRSLAYTAAPAPGDDNWYHAKLYTVDARGGSPRQVLQPPLQTAVPRWSSDGQNITFIEGIMSDKGSTGGDIWMVPAAGGKTRNLTEGRKGTPAWMKWLPKSKRLLFTEMVDGGSGVDLMDPATGAVTELWRDLGVIAAGEDHLSPKVTDVLALSIANDERTSAVLRSSVEKPPEVWVGPIGAWQQRTHLNADVRPTWGPVENLHWGSDGRSVEGWLVYPQPYDGRRRYPLIVVIHGGPANQMSASWPEATRFDPCVLSCHGYFVLCPNIRGSYGQGEAYTQGNVKDYAFGPLRDLLAGVDHVIATHSVDPDRLGVAGGSYGGSTTMFTVTQTHRFRAAVAEAGFSDAFAKYGQTSIDQWMPFYFGATAYDDPEAYRKVSAITYVRNVRTPTLLIVGAGDKLNPPAQSIEFWHALEREGVPSQLVIYNGEGHGPRSKRHIEDRMDRIVRWFDRFLQ